MDVNRYRMPTSLWFVVTSHRFNGCQSTMCQPRLHPCRIECAEVVLGQDPQIRVHEGMPRTAQLVAADRLEVLRLGLWDADLVGHEPRLIHAAGNRIPLDLEGGDAERVEDVRAGDVQDDRSAPAAADARGACGVPHGNLQ